jgi:hypothetical protein
VSFQPGGLPLIYWNLQILVDEQSCGRTGGIGGLDHNTHSSKPEAGAVKYLIPTSPPTLFCSLKRFSHRCHTPALKCMHAPTRHVASCIQLTLHATLPGRYSARVWLSEGCAYLRMSAPSSAQLCESTVSFLGHDYGWPC